MKDIIISTMIIILTGSYAWVGSQEGHDYHGIPILIIIAGIGFLIHWLVYIFLLDIWDLPLLHDISNFLQFFEV